MARIRRVLPHPSQGLRIFSTQKVSKTPRVIPHSAMSDMAANASRITPNTSRRKRPKCAWKRARRSSQSFWGASWEARFWEDMRLVNLAAVQVQAESHALVRRVHVQDAHVETLALVEKILDGAAFLDGHFRGVDQ